MSKSEDSLQVNPLTLQALIAPVVAILVICVGVILSVLMTGTKLQDLSEIARSQQIARGAFDVVGRDLGRLAIGHARSQLSYEKLVDGFDREWAEQRLDEISNLFGSARGFVLDGDDTVIFAAGGAAGIGFPEGIRSLIDAARTLPAMPPDTRTGFVRFDGRVYVAATSIVAPPEWDDEARGGEPSHVLLLIQPVGPLMLSRLASDFLLEDLRFVPPGQRVDGPSIDLVAYDGEPVGTVSWTPAQPGQELRGYILIPIFVATLLAGLLLATFLKTAARTARNIRRGAIALAESGQALEHVENKLQAILDGVADGIVSFDENGRITSVNAAAARIFGYEPEEMLGEPAGRLLAASNADGAAGLLRGGGPATNVTYRDLVGLRSDGTSFPLDSAISHITYQSKSIAIAILRDVSETRQAEETLNLLATGMILVDRECRLLQANRSAARILDSGDGLALRNGRVTAATNSQSEQLRSVVSRICSGFTDGDDRAHSVLTIDRGEAVRPLSLMVAPLQLNNPGRNVPVAAIFVRDLEVRRSVPPEVLAKLFGLTPAEARVVVELVTGKRPQEVADELGVSLNTVRNQLKQIFSKTNTGRQSELISLVLSSAAFVSEHGFEIDESDPPIKLSAS